MSLKASFTYLLCLLCLVTGITRASVAPTRRALVIGNDSYPGNGLQNARNDAKSVSQALNSVGYVVTLGLDLNRIQMTQAITSFSDSLTAGDTAIVYYAGHGLQVAGDNYLVPTDFRVSDEADVKYQGYPLGALLEKLTLHGAVTQIVILDACRDNPFLASRSTRGGWASIATSAGTFLAFGTSPGSTASDDPSDNHGLFTKSLLKFLVSSPLDVEQMFQRVREDVIRSSNGHQVPWTASSLIGSFHVLPQDDASAAPLGAIAKTDEPLPLDFGRTFLRSSRGPIPSPQPKENYTIRRSAPPVSNPPVNVALPSVPATSSASSSDQVLSLLTAAQSQVRALRLNEAVQTLQTVLSLDPASAIALRLLGVVMHLTGRSVEGVQSLERAIQLDPQDGVAYSFLCLIHAEQSDAAALADCEKAVNLKPDLTEAHLGLAISLTTAGELPRAYGEATRAIALDPTSAPSFALRGDLAAAQGHRGIAQQDYVRADQIAIQGR